MKSIFRVAILMGSVFALANSALAVDGIKSSGSISVRGMVIDRGCDVAGDSVALSIDMGSVDVSAFGRAAGATAGSSAFEIPLSNCPVLKASGVGIVFDGPADLADTRLLAVVGRGAARGIGVAFYEADGTTLIPLHRMSAFKPIAVGQGDMLLRYVVKYQSTSALVMAGNAAASATFTLVYN